MLPILAAGCIASITAASMGIMRSDRKASHGDQNPNLDGGLALLDGRILIAQPDLTWTSFGPHHFHYRKARMPVGNLSLARTAMLQIPSGQIIS
ncbi:hypothetical protein AFE_1316 [Acidithiobacillus ferrooxidans ATCC 23270]|uniref:Uncharacterized protein n=1 Tax=Acidithiobacillus ferrooxidans (strain ATCC 23270 / DSM 14882 / CIP 104768 / NCIMB 8455) TaxID=243159 RepID=B7J9C1_ACIF2|nr:hypothetical protein AFE_1316 [Acidithiobacillus ferrooxidans ATCC 23270]